MDQDTIKRRLARADTHVALGQQLIGSQRELVQSIERRGRDAADARQLLAMFVELQLMHMADRDRLRGELSATATPSLEAGEPSRETKSPG